MAVYTRSRPFAGKTQQIEDQYNQFWSHAAAAADVEAYLRGTPDHQYAAPHPKWLRASTPFTRWEGRELAESAHALLIGNRASFDAAQYPGRPEQAGMSMVHILAIPKAGLFNGVSLTPRTAGLLDEMMSFFRSCWARPRFRHEVLLHQRLAIERRDAERPDPDAYRTAMEHFRELQAVIDDLTPDDFTFGLHLWPDHSVGHLHLHILATPDRCRKYSTYAHDAKTKDAMEVRDFIRSRSGA
ncbi:hypothetical protein F5Y05DRAFT_422906 [Hypoxylon sp. FL0543]|nr:hypothetical protein F5Y05DRAFT_422906 [Hypoxylon sp. FL0543]